MERTPDAGFIYTGVVRVHWGFVYKKMPLPVYDFYRLLYEGYINPTILYRKRDWKQVGGYDESFLGNLQTFSEWDFQIRLGERGLFGVPMPEHLFYYRVYGTSMYHRSVQYKGQGFEQIKQLHGNIYNKETLDTIRQEWHKHLGILREDNYAYLSRNLSSRAYRFIDSARRIKSSIPFVKEL